MSSFFHHVEKAPADAIFGLNEVFALDPRPNKVDLLVGIYKNEDLCSTYLPSVEKAKVRIFKEKARVDYLPIDGSQELIESIGRLSFGEALWQRIRGRTSSAQTVGGTNALRLAADLFRQEVGNSIAISNPTWANHQLLFSKAGYQVSFYPYYSEKTHAVDFTAMCHTLNTLPENTLVLLQPVCHNPTGADLSLSEWKQLSYLMKEKRLFPLFDAAYQGFGEGLEEDAKVIRWFVEEGHEIMLTYSCSKNFSLYCQRVGVFFLVSKDENRKLSLQSQIKPIIRALFSNPPEFGGHIVSEILQDPILKVEWENDVTMMRNRLKKMRYMLAERLSNVRDFSFLKHHAGMFSYLGLTKEQVQRLQTEFGVYMTGNGRISVAGLNEKNLQRVANSIEQVL